MGPRVTRGERIASGGLKPKEDAEKVGKRRTQKRRTRKSRRGIARWIVIPALLTGVGVLACGLFEFLREGSYFELREIEVRGHTRAKQMEILDCLDARPGDNLLAVNKEEVRQRVEAHPWVRRARVGKRLPDTLWIEVEERSPVALLNNAREQTLLGLDEDGYVLPQLPNAELSTARYPVVTGIPAAVSFPGNLIEFPSPEPVSVVVKAICRSPRLKDVVSEIHWDAKRGYVLYPQSGSRQLLLGKRHVARRVDMLDQAWGFLSEQAIETYYVDTRFEAQGVVFRAELLSESQWLGYLEEGKKAPSRVAAALQDVP